MNKTTKLWLIIATFILTLGLIIFVGAMATLKWDFTKLSTVKYETNSHEITQAYDNISIVTGTADILLLPSESENTQVVCHEQEKMKHSVTVKDGELSINAVDTRKWYDHIGINFDTSKITVYLPQKQYGSLSVKTSTGDISIPKEFAFKSITLSASTGDVTNYASAAETVKITTSTGDIRVENTSCNALELSLSTGRITVLNVACQNDVTVNVSTGKTSITDMTCKSLISNGSTGDISLTNVIASERFSIKRDTGDVNFDSCDAGEIFIKTSTGDIKGTLLSEKVFFYDTDTGRVDLPQTVTGGKCELTTNTGDIKIALNK